LHLCKIPIQGAQNKQRGRKFDMPALDKAIGVATGSNLIKRLGVYLGT